MIPQITSKDFPFTAQSGGESDHTGHDYKMDRTIDEAFKPNGVTDNRDSYEKTKKLEGKVERLPA